MDQRITYEADQRHAEIGIKEMNMKKASTPTVPEPSEEANSRLSSPNMTKDEASRFRGLVARVNNLSLDRPDLQFAAKTQGVRLGQDQTDREDLVKDSGAAQKPAWQEKPCTNHSRTSTETGRVTRSPGNPPAAARCSWAST